MLKQPWICTKESCAERDSNLLGAVRKGYPVSFEIWVAIISSNPSYVLRPVPTAVPPWAIYSTSGNIFSILVMSLPIMQANAENSWPRVRGVASWRCVRPILKTFSNYFSFFWSSSLKRMRLGSRSSLILRTAAICITVGKLSLLDWLRLTWSLGCTNFSSSFPPNNSVALLAITSFAFMLDWVPEPVCQTTKGKCWFNFPSMTYWAALTIALAKWEEEYLCLGLDRSLC